MTQPREIGIQFSGEMVRAIRVGRKTQTRRIVKPQPKGIWRSGVALPGNVQGVQSDAFHVHANVNGNQRFLYCPYGIPGDRLYIKEAFRTVKAFDHLPPSKLPKTARIWFEADGEAPPWAGRYRHARFMPKRFARIWRENAGVRVQRLQEITEGDAKEEGVIWPWPDGPLKDVPLRAKRLSILQLGFAALWDSLRGPDAWDLNPWVWVISFKRIDTKVRAA